MKSKGSGAPHTTKTSTARLGFFLYTKTPGFPGALFQYPILLFDSLIRLVCGQKLLNIHNPEIGDV